MSLGPPEGHRPLEGGSRACSGHQGASGGQAAQLLGGGQDYGPEAPSQPAAPLPARTAPTACSTCSPGPRSASSSTASTGLVESVARLNLTAKDGPTPAHLDPHRNNSTKTTLEDLETKVSQAGRVAMTLARASELLPPELGIKVQRAAEAMADCGAWVGMRRDLNGKRRVATGCFCRGRTFCPICQKAAAAKLRKDLAYIDENMGKCRRLHLVLTAGPNVLLTGEPLQAGDELGGTVGHMNRNVTRFLQAEIPEYLGHFHRLELTGDDRVGLHPHLHCLIWVKPAYYLGNMRSKSELQSRWTKIMSRSRDVEDSTGVERAIVHISAADKTGDVAEICKYVSKPGTVARSSPAWLAAAWVGLRSKRMYGFAGRALELRREVPPALPLVGPMELFRIENGRYRLTFVVPSSEIDRLEREAGPLTASAIAEIGLRGPPFEIGFPLN